VVNGQDPRVLLLRELKERGYQFTTVSPATHEIVQSRPLEGRATLRDIFGWNRPFAEGDLDDRLFRLMEAGGLLNQHGALLRSKLRVASLGADLFLHSAFPTDDQDAVFFGPDSYRFARFIQQRLRACPRRGRIVDMGAGCGVGGIVAKRELPDAAVTLVDINPAALELANINASAADVRVDTVQSESLRAGAEIVIANPPYIMDPRGRIYRDGGDLLGGRVALDWAEQAIARLGPGGTMLLYTGAAFSDGRSPLLDALRMTCSRAPVSLTLEEIDPDVFGDELVHPPYRDVERIAAIGAVLALSPAGVGERRIADR
jgi:SAM-dependent methyltransferase